MNKGINKLIFIGFLIFVVLLFLLFGIKINLTYNKTPIKKIQKLSKIKKIEILENDTLKIIIKRKNLNWFLRESINVRKYVPENIINTINNLEIIQPVPLSYFKTAQENLRNNKRTIKIYNKFYKILELNFYYDTIYNKTIFYAGSKPKNLFFVKIIGEQNENLLNYIPISEDIFIDKVLISLYPQQIKKIRIEYFQKKEQSFEILINKNNNIELYSIFPNIQKIENVDLKKIKDYLYYFYSVKYVEPDHKNYKKGNIIANIYIEDFAGGTRIILLYDAINVTSNTTDKNFCFSKINNKKFVMVDYFDLDPILRELNDFIKK